MRKRSKTKPIDNRTVFTIIIVLAVVVFLIIGFIGFLIFGRGSTGCTALYSSFTSVHKNIQNDSSALEELNKYSGSENFPVTYAEIPTWIVDYENKKKVTIQIPAWKKDIYAIDQNGTVYEKGFCDF